MIHVFEQGEKNAPTLLLLHGTGGNEHSLLNLAKSMAPHASILSVRGNVSENGMPRFFRRLAEGIFDEEDLIFRTNELNDFIDTSAKEYGFDRNNVIAIGYSNGANIAASLLFHHENSLNGSILFHPMVPRRGIALPSLQDSPVFIGAGKNDPLCSLEESMDLTNLLQDAGATVELHLEENGHQLSYTEVEAATHWLNKHFK